MLLKFTREKEMFTFFKKKKKKVFKNITLLTKFNVLIVTLLNGCRFKKVQKLITFFFSLFMWHLL